MKTAGDFTLYADSRESGKPLPHQGNPLQDAGVLNLTLRIDVVERRLPHSGEPNGFFLTRSQRVAGGVDLTTAWAGRMMQGSKSGAGRVIRPNRRLTRQPEVSRHRGWRHFISR